MILPVALALIVSAAVKGETVTYADKDGAVLEGYVAYDDKLKNKRPAIIVVHEWKGITDDTKQRALELAKEGYVAFAADIYGKGVRPKDNESAGKEASKYRGADRSLLRARARAAVDEVVKRKDVDASKVAAIGFCFGGTTVLELAKSGAAVTGVVSFHGGLDAPVKGDSKNIKGKVLVLHGAADPFVKKDDIAAFTADLDDAKVDWTMINYSGAVHSFTVKSAGNDPSKGAAYDAKAEKRAFAAMRAFFAELFP